MSLLSLLADVMSSLFKVVVYTLEFFYIRFLDSSSIFDMQHKQIKTAALQISFSVNKYIGTIVTSCLLFAA